ncbi:MAG: hypothetical protein RLZZ187_3076, partial [Pseudomonadota bacterium]
MSSTAPADAASAAPSVTPPGAPPGFFQERVLTVHHWTDRLFSFTCTRD